VTIAGRELLARARITAGEPADSLLVLSRGAETLDTGQPTPLKLAQRHRRYGRNQHIPLSLPDVERKWELQKISDGLTRWWGQADNPADCVRGHIDGS
jgi:hypothetical protein